MDAALPTTVTPGLSLAGLTPDTAPWRDLKSALAFTASAAARTVALDASASPGGAVARDLGRSARRDLAASIRRADLTLAGLDLWIPAAHFNDPERADRAIAATVGAAELAAELAAAVGGQPLLALTLPEDLDQPAASAITAAADRVGTRIADFGSFARQNPSETIALGLDPAARLLASADPAAEVSTHARNLAAARLSDATEVARCPIGKGRLDLTAYAAALAIAGTINTAVIDLRGLSKPAPAAHEAVKRWSNALALPGLD